MNSRAIWRKSFYDGLWLLIACAFCCFLFSWMRVWIVGQLDTERFKQIIDLLPGDWRNFSPTDFDWLMTYAGRIVLNYDEPMLVMLMAVWAIARGSDCVSGELSRGTLEMTLAQPISRNRWYFVNAAVTVIGVAIIALASWLGVWGGILTTTITEVSYPEIRIPILDYRIPLPFLPAEENPEWLANRLNILVFWPAVLFFFVLGVFLSSISAFLSSFDRYRWRTIGIAAAIFVIASMIKILGMAVASCKWTLWLSFLTCYEPESAVALWENDRGELFSFVSTFQGNFRFGHLTYLSFFLVGSTAFYWFGSRIFAKRDLPAPL